MSEDTRTKEQIAFDRAKEICSQPLIYPADPNHESRSGIAVVFLQQLKALEEPPKLEG